MKLLSILNKIIPKKQQRIVLLSNLGFRDNVRTFYDYLVDNYYQDNYEIICVSNDYYNLKRLPGVKYVGIKRGLYYYLTSKFCFYCFGKYPAKPTAEQVVINFSHGMPMKNNGNLNKETEQIDYDYFTKVLATSEVFAPIMAKIFGVTEDKVLIAGNPRNDDLKRAKTIGNYSKRIIWVPTYRTANGTREGKIHALFALEKEWRLLDNFLKEQNTALFIKIHPLEEARFQFPADLEHILFITDSDLSEQNMTLHSFIGGMDGMITDYSSLYYDYLLLNRPVLFICDDLEQYAADRGFVFENITDYMIGEFGNSFSNIRCFISSILEGEDPYYDKRKQLNETLNSIQENICQDICQKVGLIR